MYSHLSCLVRLNRTRVRFTPWCRSFGQVWIQQLLTGADQTTVLRPSWRGRLWYGSLRCEYGPPLHTPKYECHGHYWATSLWHKECLLVVTGGSPLWSCYPWNFWTCAHFMALMNWGMLRAQWNSAVSSSTLDSVNSNCIYTGPKWTVIASHTCLTILDTTCLESPKAFAVFSNLPQRLLNCSPAVESAGYLFDNTDRQSHYSCLSLYVRVKQLTQWQQRCLWHEEILLPFFSNNHLVRKLVPPARGLTRSHPKPVMLVGASESC